MRISIIKLIIHYEYNEINYNENYNEDINHS